MRKFFYLIILSSALFTACKKDKPAQASSLDLIKDSIYYYSQQTYYWNTSLPSYENFRPRSFSGSTDINSLSKEVDALSQYAINPKTNKPYEYDEDAPGQAKYSFIDEGGVAGSIGGTNGDFGFAPFWPSMNDLRIKYVYPGSPADNQGIKRGYQIVKINDKTDLAATDANVDFLIKAYAYSNTINMTLKRYDGTTFDVSLSTASYTVNPVLTSKIFELDGGKKVGYMVFNSFTELDNAQPRIDAALNAFKAASVTDLVIDLRYNGGGAVETAQYLSNLLAPDAAFGTPMFSYIFNETMSSGKATILKNQVRRSNGQTYNYYDAFDFSAAANTENFEKQPFGSFAGLNNIFFIVTGSTASASELTINNLLPKRNIKLIGNTTYGKPVGFFALNINKYQLYVPQFETKNSLGKGGYYAGMQPGSTDYAGKYAADDVSKDFGDPEEQLLKYALNYVKVGTFDVAGPKVQSTTGQQLFSADVSRALDIKLGAKQFKGMVFETPKHKK
ncbi:hypothetical protein D0C36_00970 [Mucilaginibacter conchicola]|uniref:PDZ domain-containing protein n=1 Tax=Mucilaginibacter conchicola TaxID=2303333 RepID=A0A372NWU3_9SPHI|nr:S41 family peptidase [Mucilaginibacter conchicola]RFZ94159.1 hypothetical protein D0C36_00970 [Mucilaginibacter conchicola]